MIQTKVQAPLLPTYAQTIAFLKAVNGTSPKVIRQMITLIHEQTGTPQNPVDWVYPDEWIPERLKGEYAALAMKIWQQEAHVLNPRHCYGAHLFVNNHELLVVGSDGIARISDKGELYVAGDKATIRAIDEAEGIVDLLAMLDVMPESKFGDIFPEWHVFLKENSTFVAETSAKSTLRHRLADVLSRGLVDKNGMYYDLSAQGREWLGKSVLVKKHDPKRELYELVRKHKQEQIALLRQQIETMNPYQFEHLVRQLLEAMGYEDVEVTKASGDKGVDVVGKIQLGISTITEVVQVKRVQGTISRPIVDQLRGALGYHKAIRGTIITIGSFSSGAEEGAIFAGVAPITLIDGNALLDLLVKHKVGVRSLEAIELFETDVSAFESMLDSVDD